MHGGGSAPTTPRAVRRSAEIADNYLTSEAHSRMVEGIATAAHWSLSSIAVPISIPETR